MPAANLYTTKAIQKFWVEEILRPIVRSFALLQEFGRIGRSATFFEFIGVGLELIKIAHKMKKVPHPTHKDVNKHNSRLIIDLRDDVLAHDTSFGSFGCRHDVYDGMLSFLAIKYDIDDSASKRFDYWLRKWMETDWIFTWKHPETNWILTEEEKQEPTYKRQQALKEALNNKEFSKALNLIE